MDVLCERCAGLDISKRDAKACVRVATGGKINQTTTTWTSTTNQVRELAQYLLAERVGLVVIEAIGYYWGQFYFILEEAGLNVQIVNARDARNLPGRKTGVSDAA